MSSASVPSITSCLVYDSGGRSPPLTGSFMALAPFLLYAHSLALLSLAYDGQQDVFGLFAAMHNSTDPLNTCHQIATVISGTSHVSFPPAPEYLLGMAHASASSSEVSACSVEPGSTKAVSEILCILGFTRAPFAGKGGGHATNPRFFLDARGTGRVVTLQRDKVDFTSGTVEIGAGLTWDQVYANLEPTGVSVVGSRAPTVVLQGLTWRRLCLFDKSGWTYDRLRRWIRTRASERNCDTVSTVTSKQRTKTFGSV
ncbi:hypothetical protein V8E52_006562 [Russula decolorans]